MHFPADIFGGILSGIFTANSAAKVFWEIADIINNIYRREMSCMDIHHNLPMLNALNCNKKVLQMSSKVVEKLSSGYRINRAADDAAGLVISEKLRSQIRGLYRAKLNVQEGINLCQIADSGIGDINNIMQRIRELAVQSANGIYTQDDRDAMDIEVKQLSQEIDKIAEDTNFNGVHMLKTLDLSSSNNGNTSNSFSTKLTLIKNTPHTQTTTDIFDKALNIEYEIVNGKIVVKGSVDGNEIGNKTENIAANFSFNNIFGGSNKDTFSSIIRTSDGGYFVVGSTFSNDGDLLDNDGKDGTITTDYVGGNGNGTVVPNDGVREKMLAIKLDKNGNKEWTTAIGSNGGQYLACKGVELANGSFAILGQAGTSGPVNWNIQYNIISSGGDFVASHTFDPLWNNSDFAFSYDIVADGNNFIITGRKKKGSNSITHPWVARVDQNGNFLDGPKALTNTNINQDTYLHSITKTATGFVGIGTTNSSANSRDGTSFSGGFDIYIVELDNDLNVKTSRTYGSMGNDIAYSAVATNDGGYIVTGSVNGAGGSLPGTMGGDDLFVMRFDRGGNVMWQKTYGGTGDERGNSIVANADGTFTIAGSTTSDWSGDVGASKGGKDGWVIQVNGNGDLLDARNLGSIGDDEIRSMDGSLTEGEYLIGGTVNAFGDDVGDDPASDAIRGGSDIWIAAFTGFQDKTIDLHLDNIVLEKNAEGTATKWITFDKCTSVMVGDGSTVKTLEIQARIVTLDVQGAESLNGITLQCGPNMGNKFVIQRSDMRVRTLFKGMTIDVSTMSNAQDTIDNIDKALRSSSDDRAKFGAYYNALEHINNTVDNYAENATAAESRIRDLDMAKAIVENAKFNLLRQCSQAMLAQANLASEAVLTLLR